MRLIIVFLLCFGFVNCFSQTTVADVFYDCRNRYVDLDVLKNDFAVNPETFFFNATAPTAGSIKILANKKIRYSWDAGVDNASFSYQIANPGMGISGLATVNIYGRYIYNFAGNYTNADNLTLNGCRMVNSGKFTIKNTAKVKIESNTSVLLLPGAYIEPGAVVEIKIVSP